MSLIELSSEDDIQFNQFPIIQNDLTVIPNSLCPCLSSVASPCTFPRSRNHSPRMVTDSTSRRKMLRAWTRCLFLSVLLVPTANHSIGKSKHRKPFPERLLDEDTTPKFPAQCNIRPEAMQSVAVTVEYAMMEPADSWIPEKQQAKMEEPARRLSESGNSTSERAEWALPQPPSMFDPVSINQTARVKYISKDNPLPLALIFIFLLFNMVTFIPAGGEEGSNSDITDSTGGGGRTRRPGKPWWKRWFCIVNGNRDDPAE